MTRDPPPPRPTRRIDDTSGCSPRPGRRIWRRIGRADLPGRPRADRTAAGTPRIRASRSWTADHRIILRHAPARANDAGGVGPDVPTRIRRPTEPPPAGPGPDRSRPDRARAMRRPRPTRPATGRGT